MRELREFRAHHDAFVEANVGVVGVCRDTPESNRDWTRRLRLPYPLLSDRAGDAGRALGVLRRIGLGSWNLELLRRCTLLADASGTIVHAWEHVTIRGHALEVLERARQDSPPEPIRTPARPEP